MNETPEWFTKALCRSKSQEFWYPPEDTPMENFYYDVAREVCRRCPVWDVCLDLSLSEKYGMWGGLTPKERRAKKNKSGRADHGTDIRFRQGCSCDSCETVAYTQLCKLPNSLIPENTEEPVEDIEGFRNHIYAVLYNTGDTHE
jgi:WhiB family redox-sensing transcriptional regulator